MRLTPTPSRSTRTPDGFFETFTLDAQQDGVYLRIQSPTRPAISPLPDSTASDDGHMEEFVGVTTSGPTPARDRC